MMNQMCTILQFLSWNNFWNMRLMFTSFHSKHIQVSRFQWTLIFIFSYSLSQPLYKIDQTQVSRHSLTAMFCLKPVLLCMCILSWISFCSALSLMAWCYSHILKSEIRSLLFSRLQTTHAIQKTASLFTFCLLFTQPFPSPHPPPPLTPVFTSLLAHAKCLSGSLPHVLLKWPYIAVSLLRILLLYIPF